MIEQIQPGHVFAILFAKLVFDFIKGLMEKRSSESKAIAEDLKEIKDALGLVKTDVTTIKTIVTKEGE